MSVIEFLSLSLLALADDVIQQRHLLGQQRDVKITLERVMIVLESLIDVSVKLPSLPDTFRCRFLFGGSASPSLPAAEILFRLLRCP
jgi:hypothetical protein